MSSLISVYLPVLTNDLFELNIGLMIPYSYVTWLGGQRNQELNSSQLITYPEFHFETETEVDSLTGVQQYKGNYVSNGCLQF